jgi:hypothetical protein
MADINQVWFEQLLLLLQPCYLLDAAHVALVAITSSLLQIIVANPKTAGVARWIFLALWGSKMKKGDAAAVDYITKVINPARHVLQGHLCGMFFPVSLLAVRPAQIAFWHKLLCLGKQRITCCCNCLPFHDPDSCGRGLHPDVSSSVAVEVLECCLCAEFTRRGWHS